MAKEQRVEITEQAVPELPAPTTKRAVEWARLAGMFPETLPGPRLRPAIENPEAWKYQAARLRFRMGDEDQITESEFQRRIADVSHVLVR